MEHGEPISIPQPPDQTPLVHRSGAVESTRTNEAELAAQVGIAIQHLDASRDAINSPWITTRGKFTTDQADIELEAMQAQAAGNLLTEADLLNIERIAIDLAATPGDKRQQGWGDTFQRSYEFLLDQDRFENVLGIAEQIGSILPFHAVMLRYTTAQKAIESGRTDIAARALEGLTYISVEDCLAIAKWQHEQGSLEQKWIDEAVKQASVGSAPHRLQNQVRLAAFLHGIGRDPSETIRQIKETLTRDRDQWFRYEIRGGWTMELEDFPFDYVPLGSEIPVFSVDIEPKLYALVSLLEQGMVKPAEQLASKDHFLSQCLIAYFKSKNGLDPTQNLDSAHQLAGQAKYAKDGIYYHSPRQRATLVSVESRLGLMERAEQTFQAAKMDDDTFAMIVASAELAQGYFKQGNQEKARHFLDSALISFQNAQNLPDKASVRLALKLAPLLSEQGQSPAPVLEQVLSKDLYFTFPKILLLKAKELGLDIPPLLKRAENAMRGKGQKSDSYDYLISIVDVYQALGVPSDALLDELDTIYNQADMKHKRYMMDSMITSGVCAKLDPQRRERYYKQYFDTSEATIKENDFRYNDFVDRAINEGAYKAAIYASTLGKQRLPDIETKVFTAAIAAGDYPFAREVANASKNRMLQARMIAYDALANDDFSLADAWLTANAAFKQEDLSREMPRKFGAGLEEFAASLGSVLDELDAVASIKQTAQVRITAVHILLEGLRPKIDVLDKNQREALVQDARKAPGLMVNVTEELTLLGIQAGIPWTEVRKAYRQKVRKMHPDSGEDYDPDFYAMMEEQGVMIGDVNRAFNELRKVYIRKGLYTGKD